MGGPFGGRPFFWAAAAPQRCRVRREGARFADVGDASQLPLHCRLEAWGYLASMTGAGPAIFSIVAKSNTGKTTLLEGLIPQLRTLDLTVGVLKHHHYPGMFDVPGKDTYRLAEAGADVVVGIGPTQIAVFRPSTNEYDLENAITSHLQDVDVVLIEGYKRGPYPKIEVHRSSRSENLICTPDELTALVTDRTWDLDVPQFGLEDAKGLAAFIASQAKR